MDNASEQDDHACHNIASLTSDSRQKIVNSSWELFGNTNLVFRCLEICLRSGIRLIQSFFLRLMKVPLMTRLRCDEGSLRSLIVVDDSFLQWNTMDKINLDLQKAKWLRGHIRFVFGNSSLRSLLRVSCSRRLLSHIVRDRNGPTGNWHFDRKQNLEHSRSSWNLELTRPELSKQVVCAPWMVRPRRH